MRIAVVEDDNTTRNYITDLLKNEGFLIYPYKNSDEFFGASKNETFRLIILDINLPNISGYDVCKRIKKYPEKYANPKILMLSDRNEQSDVNTGLSTGADDYIKKPFDDDELILRVHNLMNRDEYQPYKIYEYKNLKINTEYSTVTKDGENIELNFRERDLLNLLLKNKGIVVTKEKIYYYVWDTEYIPGNKTLDVCLTRLRKKIPELREYIKTYKNIGYKLVK